MTNNVFPDDKSFPIFSEGLLELMNVLKFYIQKTGEVSPKKGDLEILCHLFSAVFINTARDYIDFYRLENNDPPSEGVKCYKALVKNLHTQLLDDMIINIFNYPPEEWTRDTQDS